MIKTDLITYSKYFINSSAEIESEWLEVSTDTRSFIDGSVFIAITGENFNAVEHLDTLKEKSCPIIIYEKNEINDLKINNIKSSFDTVFVAVKDCISFIQDLANLQIKEFKKHGGQVIAISGSNGKTTTKEMLTHLLASKFQDLVISTKKNLNNYLGVPYTIFDLKKDSKYLILEFGSNSPGEIDILSNISEPDFAIVTNIGETHLEFFPNAVDGVFIEESSTYQWIKSHGKKFYLNLDDEFLNTLEAFDKVVTYGEAENADYVFCFTDDGLKINDDFLIENANITGNYNFINMAISLILASEVSALSFENFKADIASFKPSLLRSEWVEKFDSTFFLDAYNANPSSMKHAIAAFLEMAKKKNIETDKLLFIVGDMNELGNFTGSAHRELSSQLKDLNSIYIGKFSKYFDSTDKIFKNVDEFLSSYPTSNFSNYEMVFIKASRSLQLERILGITY